MVLIVYFLFTCVHFFLNVIDYIYFNFQLRFIVLIVPCFSIAVWKIVLKMIFMLKNQATRWPSSQCNWMLIHDVQNKLRHVLQRQIEVRHCILFFFVSSRTYRHTFIFYHNPKPTTNLQVTPTLTVPVIIPRPWIWDRLITSYLFN